MVVGRKNIKSFLIMYYVHIFFIFAVSNQKVMKVLKIGKINPKDDPKNYYALIKCEKCGTEFEFLKSDCMRHDLMQEGSDAPLDTTYTITCPTCYHIYKKEIRVKESQFIFNKVMTIEDKQKLIELICPYCGCKFECFSDKNNPYKIYCPACGEHVTTT